MEADSRNFLKEIQQKKEKKNGQEPGKQLIKRCRAAADPLLSAVRAGILILTTHSQHYVSYVGISLCWSHKETVAGHIMPRSGTRQQGINLLPHRGSWHNTLLDAATTLLVYCVFSVRPCSDFTTTQCSFEQQEEFRCSDSVARVFLPINNPLSVSLYIKSVWLSKKCPDIYMKSMIHIALDLLWSLKLKVSLRGKKRKNPNPITSHHLFNAKLLHKYTKHRQQPR